MSAIKTIFLFGALLSLSAALVPGECNGDQLIEDLGPLDFWHVSQTKNALVLFYGPSCPHSKVFAPQFSCSANQVNSLGVEGLQIGRIIAGQPGLGEYTPHGVPTVRFFPAGLHSSGIEYDGLRRADDLTRWVVKMSKTSPVELVRRYPMAFPQNGLALARGDQEAEVQTIVSGATGDAQDSDDPNLRYVSLPHETENHPIEVPRGAGAADVDPHTPIFDNGRRDAEEMPASFNVNPKIERLAARFQEKIGAQTQAKKSSVAAASTVKRQKARVTAEASATHSMGGESTCPVRESKSDASPTAVIPPSANRIAKN